MSSPMAASRFFASRALNPASISRRVSPAETKAEFPALLLAKMQTLTMVVSPELLLVCGLSGGLLVFSYSKEVEHKVRKCFNGRAASTPPTIEIQ